MPHALSGVARHPAGTLSLRPFYMMSDPQALLTEEPIGIVISSRTARDTKLPRFSAYVWGPAPTEPVDTRTSHAA